MKTFSRREKVPVRPDEGDSAARFVWRLRNNATQATSANDPQPSVVPCHPHLPCGRPLPAGEGFSFRSDAGRASRRRRFVITRVIRKQPNAHDET